jgi:hypothetical protein
MQQWTGVYGSAYHVDHILPIVHLMNSIDVSKWSGKFETNLLLTLSMPVVRINQAALC